MFNLVNILVKTLTFFKAPGTYAPEKVVERTRNFSFGLKTIYEKSSTTPGNG